MAAGNGTADIVAVMQGLDSHLGLYRTVAGFLDEPARKQLYNGTFLLQYPECKDRKRKSDGNSWRYSNIDHSFFVGNLWITLQTC